MSVQQQTVEFTRLISFSQRPLYAFIRAYVRDRSDADDVYQQTAMVLFEHFDSFDPARSFLGWACGIAWNKVLSHYQNVRRLRLVAGEELGAMLADKVAAVAVQVDRRRDYLLDCVAQLKPESRELLQRHYYDEQAVAQIAEEWGVSSPCIYKTLAKVRLVLLNCIERKLKEEL